MTSPTTTRSRRSLGVALGSAALLASGLALSPGAHAAAPPVKLSDAQAAARLSKAGITRSSSHHCTARKSGCTSYQGIRTVTVNGIIAFKSASHCTVNITGGTEPGHSTNGTHTHANGFKVDISKYPCAGAYIKEHYRYIGLRGDGYPQWRTSTGNIYCDEGSHWDIYYVHSAN